MSISRSYPPHPAEGRRADVFADYRAGHGWQAASAVAEPAVVEERLPVPVAAPATDRRMHWLSYDPSSRSQYPLD